MKTLIAFYKVDSEFDRHSFDTMDDNEIYEKLSQMSTDDCLIYDTSTNKGTGKEFDLADLERDYNDELLDGGWWMKILVINE